MLRMRFFMIMSCLGAVSWLITGCQLSKAYPAKRYYQLTAPQPMVKAGSGGVLRVQDLDVAPAFSGKGLVSQLSDVEFASDYYSEFFTSPNEMLTELLTTWLRKSGGFEAVVGAGSALSADYVIEGTLDKLYLDRRDESRSLAVLSLQLRFIDDRGGKPDLVTAKRYHRAEAIESATPEAVVAGWNRGLGAILIEVQSDLSESVAAASTASR